MPKGVYARKPKKDVKKVPPAVVTIPKRRKSSDDEPVQHIIACPSPEHFVSRLDYVFSGTTSDKNKAVLLQNLYETLEKFLNPPPVQKVKQRHHSSDDESDA